MELDMTIPDYLIIHIGAIRSQIEVVNSANISSLYQFVNQQLQEILGRIECDPMISEGANKLAKVTSEVIANNASEESKQTAFSAIRSFEDLLKSAKPNEVTKILRID
jgi:hypothetical protein